MFCTSNSKPTGGQSTRPDQTGPDLWFAWGCEAGAGTAGAGGTCARGRRLQAQVGPQVGLESWNAFLVQRLKGETAGWPHMPILLPAIFWLFFPQRLFCPLCWSHTRAFAAAAAWPAGSAGERSPKLSCHLLVASGGEAERSRACGTGRPGFQTLSRIVNNFAQR